MTPERSTLRRWYAYVLAGIITATLGILLMWWSNTHHLSDDQLDAMLHVFGTVGGCTLLFVGAMLATRYLLLLSAYGE